MILTFFFDSERHLWLIDDCVVVVVVVVVDR